MVVMMVMTVTMVVMKAANTARVTSADCVAGTNLSLVSVSFHSHNALLKQRLFIFVTDGDKVKIN